MCTIHLQGRGGPSGPALDSYSTTLGNQREMAGM